MTKTFEYKVVKAQYMEYDEEEAFLNKMGQEGWEMIDAYGWKYRLKREKK